MAKIGGKNYPDDFLEILSEVFGFEGGIANHPLDRGGYTNMGITKPFLTEYFGRPATDADIDNLTKQTAVDAYYKNLWEKHGIENYPNFLRREAFNSFTGSIWLGQQFTKILQRKLHLLPDGVVGPKSIASFAETEQWLPNVKRKLNNEVVFDLIKELIGICRRNPSQIVFLEGWWNRYGKFFEFNY